MTDIAAIAKALQGAIGENSEKDEVSDWLDTGYAPLNKIIGGAYDKGLPYGRLVEIYGPPASGKTALATLAMIAAQKAGGLAAFVDYERAWNSKFAEEMGLNTEFPHFVYKRPKTWEEGNTVAMKFAEVVRQKKLIKASAPIVIVQDSIAAAIPRSVLEKGIDEYTMNDTTALARVTSTTIKAVNQFVGEFNAIMIYLNQIRLKPGVVYGDPTTTPGGSAMEFYASVRLALGAKKIMEEDADGDKEFIGRQIGITTKKNKLNRPFQEIDLRLTYADDGKCVFDFTRSLIDHLVDLEKLEKGTKGMVIWTDGVAYNKKALAAKIDGEGKQAELNALLLK